MAKMGRPKKEIDKKAFESLCAIQCTRHEMCSFFDVSFKLIERWCKETYGMTFAPIFKVKRVGGIISLRRSGFQLAQTNASMSIFLHKNYMGLKDNPVDPEEANTDASPVSVVIQVEDCRKDADQDQSE